MPCLPVSRWPNNSLLSVDRLETTCLRPKSCCMPGCQEEDCSQDRGPEGQGCFLLPGSSPSLPNSDGIGVFSGEVGTSEAGSWTTGPRMDGTLDFLVQNSLQPREAAHCSAAVTLRKRTLRVLQMSHCFTRSSQPVSNKATTTGLPRGQDVGGPPGGTVCPGSGGYTEETWRVSGKPRRPLQSHRWALVLVCIWAG